MAGSWTYDSGRFDGSTIERWSASWLAILRRVAARPDLRLSRIPLLGAAQLHQLAVEWNDRRAAFAGGGRYLHRLFEEQAARTPEAVAVALGAEQLSYRGLDRRAGRLARRLSRRGVGPETRVGIFLERGPTLVAGLLAVLKAGGAYLPLDPDDPAERLAWLLADSRVPVVLTETRLRFRLPGSRGKVLCVDSDRAAPDRAASDRAPSDRHLPERMPGPHGDNAAYVLYTSGSSGRPKGVTICHRAIHNLILGLQQVLPLTASDRLLQKTALTFDASVWEFWAPLQAGGAAGPGSPRNPPRCRRSDRRDPPPGGDRPAGRSIRPQDPPGASRAAPCVGCSRAASL